MRNTGWLVLAATLLATGCVGGGRTPDESSTAVSAVEQQQLMARWNSNVEGNPSSSSSTEMLDFNWSAFDQFPHPTYQGGSAEAYQTFARLLLTFMQADDSFDYLAKNRLFDNRLGYRMANGDIGVTWSFRELVTEFSSETMFGQIPEETRTGLKEIAARIAVAG